MVIPAAGTPAKNSHVEKLQQMITNSWMSQALYVAAELKLADWLIERPRTSSELADVTSTHEPSLKRLMDALTTMDICTELEGGTFAMTDLGKLLCSDTPDSLRAWTIWWGAHLWQVWGNLLYSIQTGKSARAMLSGTEGFGHLEKEPGSADVFYQITIELTRITARYVVPAYDFSGFRHIVDVGGGYGEMLAAILRAHPDAKGTLYDLPIAIAGAKEHIKTTGVDDRCTVAAGDFFKSVPAGGDAYILKNVIHDWNDERSLQILATCRKAMTVNACLLLIEQILPETREVTANHQMLSQHDLTMLVACGAQERTEKEYAELLTQSGFRLNRAVPAGPTFSIIEAIPVQ